MNVRAIVAAALGLLMVTAAVGGITKYAVPVSVCATVLVLAGLRFRIAAILAVLSAIGALALGNTPAVLATLSGLAAATYLLTAYPLHLPSAVIAVRNEVIIPALLFACAALLATALPVQGQSWLPFIVPVTVVLIYVVAVWPFTRIYPGSGGAVDR
ncbi:hypothetical protein [Mycobacterium sp. NPDC050853]|uniref:hypothetical protein n=1 Tax=Mycobacterium sp. NPDC050853 TaxID=3155160 RepID=UPI0033D8DD36